MLKDKLKSIKIPPIVIKIVIVVLILVFLGGLALAGYAIAAISAPVKIKLNVDTKYQTMNGFGMAGAWYLQVIGKYDAAARQVADLLYSENGMQLDVFRYNIGAGTTELDDYASYPEERKAESFFLSENYTGDLSAFNDPNNYDIENRDVATMNVLKECLKTGNVKTLILFANSPHYLLTKNGWGSGTGTHENNLPPEHYQAHAQYMIQIGNLFREMCAGMENPPEILINPVNEPQWAWGGTDATQEGCHFDPEELGNFFQVFFDELDAFNEVNGTNLIPDIFESGNYKFTDLAHAKVKQYFNEFKKHEFYEEVPHFTVHSYAANDKVGERKTFRRWADKNLAGKEIHMSEYCVMEWGVDESIDMGLKSADVMLKDLTLLNASRWCWWLGVAPGGYEDGLIYYNVDQLAADPENYQFYRNKRYATFSQFTRFIDRGDVRVESHTPFSTTGWDKIGVASFLKADGSVTLIVLNYADANRDVVLPAGYRVEKAIFTDEDHELATLLSPAVLPAKSVVTYALVKE